MPDQLRHAPSLPVALVSLLGIRLALKVVGMGRTARMLRRLEARMPPRQDDASSVTVAVVHVVSVAGALLPGRLRCLEQALTVHALLRLRGVVAPVRLGVQPYGFTAHAWVEYHGRPVGESDSVMDHVVPFPDALL
jgi:hypothetical protein